MIRVSDPQFIKRSAQIVEQRRGGNAMWFWILQRRRDEAKTFVVEWHSKIVIRCVTRTNAKNANIAIYRHSVWPNLFPCKWIVMLFCRDSFSLFFLWVCDKTAERSTRCNERLNDAVCNCSICKCIIPFCRFSFLMCFKQIPVIFSLISVTWFSL